MELSRYRRWLEDTRISLKEVADEKTGLDAQMENLRLRSSALRLDLDHLEAQESWLSMKVGESSHRNYVEPPRRPQPTAVVTGEQPTHGDIARGIMLDEGKPMKVGDLAKIMVARGHKLPSEDNIRFNSIYSALRRRMGHPEGFVKLPDGYWGLQERDSPDQYPERSEGADSTLVNTMTFNGHYQADPQ